MHAHADVPYLIGYFRQRVRIILLDGQVDQDAGVFDILVQPVKRVDPLPQ
jgi:hypothetical protein